MAIEAPLTIETLIIDLRALAAEIDTLLNDPENPFDTLPGRIDAHNEKLTALFKQLDGADPDEKTLAFLTQTQQKIADWTQQAIEERDETRQTLLNLAQGRKARGQY